MYSSLKGVWHEIFDFKFFSWISVPPAPKYSIGAFLNFFENSWRYSRINVTVNDTGDKLFSGANDTGEKLSQVLLTPVNNLYFPGVVDTVEKKTKSLKVSTKVSTIPPKIFHRCQRHRRLESPANISLPTPKNEK